MATLQLLPRNHAARTHRPRRTPAPVAIVEGVPPAVSAARVRAMLTDIAIALHATQVVSDDLDDDDR